jgi:hypothetical protein
VSPRRAFRTLQHARSAAARLLAEETQQPGHERVGEYAVTYCWDTGRVHREYYRARASTQPEYLRSEILEEPRGPAGSDVGLETRPGT